MYYFKKQFKDIKYIHSEKKKGIDLDMAETVKYAEGEYCWLVSDDDPINSHALKNLFKDLKLNHEIYLCDRVVCDKKLNPIRNRNWLRSTQSNTYKLSNPIEFENYLDNCLEFGAIFSYMCAIIFKRSEWNKTEYDTNFTNSGYGHVTRIFDIIHNGGILKYINKPLLLNRSFNDSFMSLGIKRRFMLDIDGYTKLASRCLEKYEESIRKKFLKVMLLEHPWYQLIKLKSNVHDHQEWEVIKEKIKYCGYSDIEIKLSEILSFNKTFIKLLVYLRYLYNTSSIHQLKYFFGQIINKKNAK